MVLVVEDEEHVRRTLGRMLRSLNYRMLAAANGREALALLDRHRGRVSLVLTDLTMPGINGLELAPRLRERDPQIQTVVLTGYPIDAGTSAEPGQTVFACLQKPASLDQIAQTLARAMDTRPRATQVARGY